MNIWIIFQFGIVTIKEHFCISLCTIRAFIALGQICTCGIAGWAGRWKPEVNLDIIPWEPSSLVLFFFFFNFTLRVCFACLPVCVPCVCLLDALELCLWMVVNHHACARAPNTLKCWTSCPVPTLVLETGALPGSGACKPVRLVRDLQWPLMSIHLPVLRLQACTAISDFFFTWALGFTLRSCLHGSHFTSRATAPVLIYFCF